MYATLSSFLADWASESAKTLQLLRTLSDGSLSQAVEPEGRTVGRLAWHITQTVPEMVNRTGLTVSGPTENAPVPSRAAEIVARYEEAAAALATEIETKWQDATLLEEDDMYGQRWKRGATLQALILHQAHHRGQMTVLMRQAGLRVPGIYGPAREEWAAFGAAPPEV
jgi:uncharacterized damage-inducible protein DinB